MKRFIYNKRLLRELFRVELFRGQFSVAVITRSPEVL